MSKRIGLGWFLLFTSLGAGLVGGEPAEKKSVKVDCYGDPLPEGVVARLGTVRFRHPGNATSVAYSPKGDRVASASKEGVAVWDVETGKRVVFHPTDYQNGVGMKTGRVVIAYAPDGCRIAIAPDIGPLHIWNAATGEEVRAVEEFIGAEFVAFTPDGRSLIAGATTQVLVADTHKGETRQFWQVGSEQGDRGFQHFALSPDGKALVTGSVHPETPYLRLWDVESGEEVRRIPARGDRLAFADDGKTLFALGSHFFPTVVSLIEIDTWTVRKSWQPEGRINNDQNLTVSRDGKLLAVNGRLYEAESGKDLRPIRVGGNQWTGCCDFSPDGDRFVVVGGECGEGGCVALCETATGRLRTPMEAHVRAVYRLGFLSEGQTVVSASRDGSVRLWDPVSGRSRSSYTAQSGGNVVLGGSLCAIEGQEGIPLFEVQSGRRIKTLVTGKCSRHSSIQISADDRVVLWNYSEGNSHGVEVWDITSGTQVRRIQLDRQLNAMAISPDGKLVALATSEGTLELWESATGKRVNTLEKLALKSGDYLARWPVRADADYSLAFSRDGRLLASSNETDAAIRLWDTATGNLVRECAGHFGGEGHPGWFEIWSFSFSADSRLLATYSRSGELKVWEVASLKGIWSETRRAGLAQFSPKDDTLAVACCGTNMDIRTFALAGAKADETRFDAEAVWADLASLDAAKARQAMRAGAAHSARMIDLLKDRIRPVARLDQGRIQQMLTQLDAEDFDAREQASNDLARFGDLVGPALHQLQRISPSEEVRRRVALLLARLKGPLPAERLRLLRIIEMLEGIGSPESIALLERVATGEPMAHETIAALAVLARRRPE